jgi:hypothetical protein
MSSSKQFSGIFFSDSSWQVVPSNWVYKEDGIIKVWWPSEGDVTELARKKTRVGKRWKASIVDSIGTTSSKYLYINQLTLLKKGKCYLTLLI